VTAAPHQRGMGGADAIAEFFTSSGPTYRKSPTWADQGERSDQIELVKILVGNGDQVHEGKSANG